MQISCLGVRALYDARDSITIAMATTYVMLLWRHLLSSRSSFHCELACKANKAHQLAMYQNDLCCLWVLSSHL